MTLRSQFSLLLLLAGCLTAGAVHPVKPKTPVVSVESLLHEAEQAYRSYRFEMAASTLAKYQAAMQRRREPLPERAQVLISQLARAERMYSRAELLHVVDSAIVDKRSFFTALPQGGGKILAEEHYLSGDSLMKATSYQDALKKNYLRASQTGLQWLSSLGGAGTGSWELRPMNLSALGEDRSVTSPFLLEDGTTLLFGRLSDQGLGGYDLYMTRLTEQGNSFFEPTLLGMPYNSPSNDYLLAYHESEGWGVLVSDRFAPTDSVHIYRFTGRPAFLAKKVEEEGEAMELTEDERFRRASLQGVLYADSTQAHGATNRVTDAQKAKEGEFYFLLQGNRVYRHWADFMTTEGMKAFRRAEELRASLEGQEEHLRTLRQRWSTITSSDRESLRAEILLLETTVQRLRRDLQQALHSARYYEGVR